MNISLFARLKKQIPKAQMKYNEHLILIHCIVCNNLYATLDVDIPDPENI